MTADTYPSAPGFKAHGTSELAASAVAPIASNMRQRVLDGLRAAPQGLTADELAHSLNISTLSVRPRLSELKRLGQVVDSGERRKHDSGMTANVWRVTPPQEAA